MLENGEARKVLVALATAGILGAWSFAATRASSEDIESVRKEVKEVEAEAKERHGVLAKSVDEIKKSIQTEAIAAASFRAQVREALKIKK
jgi:predicted nucleotide-binding protein (sugar kinase/HSP70/actin superfamily)